MHRVTLAIVSIFLTASVALAQFTFPATFQEKTIRTADGADIFVRVGGSGPVVILLHGFGDTGDMWVPVAADLAKNHTLIIPDLRGMGRSSHPAGSYDKRTEAADIRSVVEALGYDRAGTMLTRSVRLHICGFAAHGMLVHESAGGEL